VGLNRRGSRPKNSEKGDPVKTFRLFPDYSFPSLWLRSRRERTTSQTVPSASSNLRVKIKHSKSLPLQMTPRKKILMVAYACHPEGGGEHWLGWGWAMAAKRHHDVWLLTPANNVEPITRHAAEAGIDVSFVTLPEWQRSFCGLLGGAGSWLRKYLWQFQALRKARELQRKVSFDLVHQTTFHTFRIPFACSRLGIPSVWGPIAGGESVPRGFDRFLGGDAGKEKSRARANRLCLSIPGVRSSLGRCAAILVSNRTTIDFLPAADRPRCILMPANAVSPRDAAAPPREPSSRDGKRLELIYVGNCVSRRALPIVFEALREFTSDQVRFRVVGNGEALDLWKQEAMRIGVEDRVEFTGGVDADMVRRYYDEADALGFPSLRDSGGSALLEAMTRGLPVICLDWGGPAEMVDEHSGIRLPVNDPDETVALLVAALRRLKAEPEWGRQLAVTARERALTLYTWEGKGAALDDIYNRIFQP
jgi:glycosyltransferase involved in cell wall biosynthesis